MRQNEDGTIDYSKFVKIAAKQVLKIHAQDLVTIHLQVKLHNEGQEEVRARAAAPPARPPAAALTARPPQVFSPTYPHMKRCAWFAILADPNHNRIMDFKR